MKIPVRVIRPEEDKEDPNNRDVHHHKDAGKGVDTMADNQDVKPEPEVYYEDPDEQEADEQNTRSSEEPADRAEAKEEKDPDAENWRDKYTRLLADFENFKRNTRKERERLAAAGKEAVLEDVFPVIEHMERAIDSARQADDNSGILQGIEMVYRELLSVLEKHGVERIRATGEPFDPQLHEAVSMTESEDHPEGTVVEELRPGFKKGERLLRPAQVIVAQ